MSKFICESQKYQLGGPGEATIVLPIWIANLPEEIEVEGHKLSLKTEFHVSLVCVGKIMEKHKVSRPDFINEIARDFCEFVKNKNVDFAGFSGEFRFAARNEKRTVIAMCEVSNLNEFFDVMNKKYGLKVESPPAHVTLYTLQPNLGIFLVNNEDINNLTKTVVLPLTLKNFK